MSGHDRSRYGYYEGNGPGRCRFYTYERQTADKGGIYFADIENGLLQYFTIGIENPVVEVEGNHASITYTSVLNANAYGARGVYRMTGTHGYEKADGEWMSSNGR